MTSSNLRARFWIVVLVLSAAFNFTGSAYSQATNGNRAASNERIIGGSKIDGIIKKAPWVMSLRVDNRHTCGASFVAPKISSSGSLTGWSSTVRKPRWAVTAAHCLFHPVTGKPLSVDRLSIWGGTLNLEANPSPNGEIQQVEEYFVPKGDYGYVAYDSVKVTNDIALLKLSEAQKKLPRAVRVSIRLPRLRDMDWFLQPYTAFSTAGWGRTSQGGPASLDLLSVQIPLVERSFCQQKYSEHSDEITLGMLCAGFSSGEFDACQGDSGGPLYYNPSNLSPKTEKPVLAGIVSWGRGCGNANLFGIYTNITYYKDWLEAIVINND